MLLWAEWDLKKTSTVPAAHTVQCCPKQTSIINKYIIKLNCKEEKKKKKDNSTINFIISMLEHYNNMFPTGIMNIYCTIL